MWTSVLSPGRIEGELNTAAIDMAAEVKELDSKIAKRKEPRK